MRKRGEKRAHISLGVRDVGNEHALTASTDDVVCGVIALARHARRAEYSPGAEVFGLYVGERVPRQVAQEAINIGADVGNKAAEVKLSVVSCGVADGKLACREWNPRRATDELGKQRRADG